MYIHYIHVFEDMAHKHQQYESLVITRKSWYPLQNINLIFLLVSVPYNVVKVCL